MKGVLEEQVNEIGESESEEKKSSSCRAVSEGQKYVC